MFKPKKKEKLSINLSESIDIEKDIDNFKQKAHKLFNPKELYRKRSFLEKESYIQKISEEPICSTDSNQNTLIIFDKKACKPLLEKKLYYTHLGLIVVGIKGMIRKNTGARVVMVIYDDSITDQRKKIIATMDVDMNENKGLFYCAPYFFLKTRDLPYIRLGILSQGYGDMTRDNLVITTGLLGKAVSNTEIKYKCEIQDVIEGMASKGIRFIKAPEFSGELYAGRNWQLDQLFNMPTKLIEPTKGEIFTDAFGGLSLRFSDYRNREPIPETETESDTSSAWGIDEDNIKPEKQLVEINLVDNDNPLLYIFIKHRYYFKDMEEFKDKINFFVNLSIERRKKWLDNARRNNKPIDLLKTLKRIYI